MRNVVDAGRHAGAEKRNVGRISRQIRAHVGDEVDVEREEAALVVERELRRGDVVAALRVAEEMLGALGDPGHRLLELLRGERGQRVFAIDEQLGAEAAADVRRHHAHLLRRQLEHLAQACRGGSGCPGCRASASGGRARVVFGDDAAGVEIVGDQALVDQRQRHACAARSPSPLRSEPARRAPPRRRDCPAGPARPAPRPSPAPPPRRSRAAAAAIRCRWLRRRPSPAPACRRRRRRPHRRRGAPRPAPAPDSAAPAISTPGMPACIGIRPRPPMSSPVRTSRTPGMALAVAASSRNRA